MGRLKLTLDWKALAQKRTLTHTAVTGEFRTPLALLLIAESVASAIDADISLISTFGSGGVFDVTTTTSNSDLNIDFPASPVNSHLEVLARTSNGVANIYLNPAYEGKFSLATSSAFQTSVHEYKDVVDPSGKGRNRKVQYKKTGRGTVEGTVQWQGAKGEGKPNGVVVVRTSNAPISLDL